MTYDQWKQKMIADGIFYEVDLADIIAFAITDLRITEGMTQARLARKIGMKQSAIARLEAGRTKPNLKTLERIARAFKKQVVLRFDDI